MTIQHFYSHFKKELNSFYEVGEIKSFYNILMNKLGFTSLQVVLGEQVLNKEQETYLNQAIERLKYNEPIQHIVGTSFFYGLEFNVGPHVLIPRPETEELVDWVVKDVGDQQKTILDVCSGSGCIGISLKKSLPRVNVKLLEVSPEALVISRQNALENNVVIEELYTDVLHEPISGHYDIIVSNPPYIRFEEKKSMATNVLRYEPHLALFVNDGDPLLFYRKIAKEGLKVLNRPGVIYFEINEAFGEETVNLLSDLGYETILRKDINGKDRMIKATLKK